MNSDKEVSVDDINNSLKRFGLADYVVFVFMLVMCSVVGVYFGYKDHKKSEKSKLKARRGSGELDYLVGGRQMQIWPVAMSLAASGTSAIMILGVPSEVYYNGINIIYAYFPLIFVGLFVHRVTIPIFYDLQIVSTYEYLNLRFDNKVRLFGSFLFLLNIILWLSIVIYLPALSFNQTTGLNVHLISVLVCLVCVFYTLLGGIKAVVWTDVIQILLMYGSLALILVSGIVNIGSLSTVIERNLNGTRLDPPKLDFDLTERHSVISLFVGGTAYMLNLFGTNQFVVQRYMSLPSVKAAQKALLWNIGAVTALISMCGACGLLLFAQFHDCDPLTTKLITAKDQLLPLLVMQNLGRIPGFTGLFIAGVFSASLSSLSTALNSAAAVVLEDFWKPNAKHELSERKTAYIMRATVLIIGSVSVILVPVVQKLGGVFQLAMSVTSASFGPLFGLFFIGFFLPWIKAKGALIGALSAIIVSMYVVMRAQADQASGGYNFDTKPTSVEGCYYSFTLPNSSFSATTQSPKNNTLQLHHISNLLYSPLGTLITVAVAYIVTLIDRDTDPRKVDMKLLAPFLRKYFSNDEAASGGSIEITEHVFAVVDNTR